MFTMLILSEKLAEPVFLKESFWSPAHKNHKNRTMISKTLDLRKELNAEYVNIVLFEHSKVELPDRTDRSRYIENALRVV